MSILSGLLASLLLTSLAAPVVYADSHTDDSGSESDRVYQIVQGEQVLSIEPVSGDETVEEFYDYRHPYVGSRDDPSWGRSFSSVGTTDYQRDDTSILLLYEGPQGVSLVAVHDRYHEEQSQGTPGGSLSWTVDGLPESGEWAVIDDEYGWLTENESKDDIFRLDAAHRAGAPGNDGAAPVGTDALLSWVWTTGRSDGVAYRGLENDASIVINPAFNNESYHRYGDERRPDVPPDRPEANAGYNGIVDDWDVVVPSSGDDDDVEHIELNSLDEPVAVRSTSTPPAPRSVSLDTDRIDPGDTATLSATIENPGSVEWTYEAQLRVYDTDLQTETVTVPAGEERTVEFTQQFGEAGRYEIGVGTEQATLTVGDPDESTDDSPFDDPDETGDTEGTDGTDDRTPGFGPVAALIALLVVAVGMKSRTGS
ncbi:MAG: PGF-CTERM sorting domain-containing protein [Euryarchaeota archaeon]|nr:PGF-CTERM sorting domain-containing protein [Euryarchaeota archaeon]